MKKKQIKDIPSIQTMEAELKRVKHRKRYIRVIQSTLYTLITVAAVAALVATLWMPVLQIHGNSMSPTMNDGNILVSVKGGGYESGDIIAFYYNNKILVKRVIAITGDWVDMDENGNVFVNSTLLDEPYLAEKAYGDCDLEFPYQVPAAKLFVMGDQRSVSVDSRNSGIGCIADDQIVGKIVFRVWPLSDIGAVD